jgi:hypothetical protein
MSREDELAHEVAALDAGETGEVYFIRCQEFIKIGFSTSTKGGADYRLRVLQCGCPYPLELLHVIRGVGVTVVLERRLHRLLAKHRTHGEWFAYAPTARLIQALPCTALTSDYIDELVSDAEFALLYPEIVGRGYSTTALEDYKRIVYGSP